MADPLGFLKHVREDPQLRPSEDCIRDFRETRLSFYPPVLERQAGRCMECGVPFCELDGCPVGNRIQDWVSLMCGEKWKAALDILHSTNNFPEITGRLCAAPCERACILSINFAPVTIREIEREIADRGWREGWIVPEPPRTPTDRRIALIGSGPAGLAAAQELARAGHAVTVFDRDDRVGGILRYGIPDFALDKRILDRRIDQLIGEGVVFETGVVAGVDLSIGYLKRSFDVVVILTGSRSPRDIAAHGRDLGGICFAMDYLVRQNRINAGDTLTDGGELDARGKRVVIVGGGETAAYCVGVCRRQGAVSVAVLDTAVQENRSSLDGKWGVSSESASSQLSADPLADDCMRLNGVAIERFLGHRGKVRAVAILTPEKPSEKIEYSADLVIIALGFEHVEPGPLIRNLSIDSDERGNLKVDGRFMTSAEGVFAAGDCVLGGSSVVHSIAQGRRVAGKVDRYLSERSV